MNFSSSPKIKPLAAVILGSALLVLGLQAGAFGPLSKNNGKPATPPPPPLHDKWAVIVGCNQFQDPSLAPVKFAVRNAAELAATLKDPNIGRFPQDHIAVVSGIHATKSGVEHVINGNWLLRKALPNDIIVIYFCTRVAPSADDLRLCTYDTLASEADTSAISLVQTLKTLKSRTQSHRILCILDTSPASEKETSANLNAMRLSRLSSVSIFTANKLSSDSYESPVAATSFFVHALIEGLKAGSGMVTLAAVSQYVEQSVPEEVQKFLQKEQHPEFAAASDSPDFPGIALGFVLKQLNNMAGLNIGHRMDNLQLTRPDLAQQLKIGQDKSKTEGRDEDDDDQPAANVDFGTYMAKMKQAIQKKWQPPKGFENRRVVTVFTIMRDGSIVDPRIVEATGVEAIDKAALEALHAASPLDPLPLGAPKSVQIKYQFDWRVTPH